MLVIPADGYSGARARLSIVFFILLFLIFSPSPPNPYRLIAIEAQVTREKHALEILKNATYLSPLEVPRYLNLTGVSQFIN